MNKRKCWQEGSDVDPRKTKKRQAQLSPHHHKFQLVFRSTDERNQFEDRWDRYSRAFRLGSPTQVVQDVIQKSLEVPAYVSVPGLQQSFVSSKFRKHICCVFDTRDALVRFSMQWMEFRQKFVDYSLTMSFFLAFDLVFGELPKCYLSASPSNRPCLETTFSHLNQTGSSSQSSGACMPMWIHESEPLYHQELTSLGSLTTETVVPLVQLNVQAYHQDFNDVYSLQQTTSTTPLQLVQSDALDGSAEALDLSKRREEQFLSSSSSSQQKYLTDVTNLEQNVSLKSALKSLHLEPYDGPKLGPDQENDGLVSEGNLEDLFIGDHRVIHQLITGIQSHVHKKKCDSSLKLIGVHFKGDAVRLRLVCQHGHAFRFWFHFKQFKNSVYLFGL